MEQITKAQVRRHLAEILNSGSFQASQRLKSFLSYIVEATLAGRGQDLKAYTIATEVFRVGKDFDPRLNPLVRTEAVRLRSKLDHYYLSNPDSEIRISIPKGGYTASFQQNLPLAEPVAGEPPAPYSFSEFRVRQPEHKATMLVLPFNNINQTADVDRFIAGLTNELITGLTR